MPPAFAQALFAGHASRSVIEDPGGFVHNPDHTLQVPFDSFADLGCSTAAVTRR